MSRPPVLIAILIVGFIASFGIGKATAGGGGGDEGGSKKAVKADVASSEVDAPELAASGKLPALRVKRSSPAAGSGGGGSAAPSTPAPAASSPAPSAPSTPSAPAPSAPAPTPTPSPPAGGCDNC